MSLKTKTEKMILVKDTDSKNKAIIKQGILDASGTVNPARHVLTILQNASSTDVITTVGTFTELNQNRMDPNGYKFVEKALFVKDMATQAGTANTLPIYPGAKETITFQPGESAIVYYDDDVQSDGFGRPHWLKFLNDDTLAELSITKVKDLATLTGRPNFCWYYVENMENYPGYEALEQALVYKLSDTSLKTIRFEEDDFVRGDTLQALHNMLIPTLSTSTAAPTTSSDAIYLFGDLSDTAQRSDFMDAGQVGQWGTAIIGTDRYLFNIKSGTNLTNFILGGFRFVVGANGWTSEFVQVNVSKPVPPAVATGSFTGEAFSSSLNLPIAYTALQYVPKAVIDQMFLDNAPQDPRHWVVFEANQIESVLEPGGSKITWRMGDNLLTIGHPDGHPIDDNMTISFSQGTAQSEVKIRMVAYDAANVKKDINDVIITDGHNTRQVIRALDNTVVGSFFPIVTKITDWKDGWDGTPGNAVDTQGGWKVELTDPRDVNGATLVFPATALPTQMTLDSMRVGADDVQVILTQSDLMPQLSTWLTQGISNHISGSFTEGWATVFNVVDARMEKTLGAWDGSHQWTGTSHDMSTIGIGRPRYLIMGIVNDQTAGYQYYARFKFELVKADGSVAAAGDVVDYTKTRMTYEGTKGADAVGQALTHRPRTFTGFDLKEGV